LLPEGNKVITYLQVENLSRSYGEKVLFRNISFFINKEQRVALIARNGTGKTTLFNILAGTEMKDEGTVTFLNNATTGYLMQEPVMNEDNTVFEEVRSSSNDIQRTILEYEQAILGQDKERIEKAIHQMDAKNGWEYETRIRQILTQLKISNLDQRIGTLSGGQKKRVALARVLITEPDLLLLDEPTNHLDVEMVEWLEEYLSRSGMTIFMVTHDRYFLDRVCNEILELDDQTLFRYKGNYSYFLEKQQERKDIADKEKEKAVNLLRTEQEWMRRMPKARGTKAKARIGSYHELKAIADKHSFEGRLTMNIKETYLGKKILELNDIHFKWGELPILSSFSYIFKRHEKIGIIGSNGLGKSTFLDILTGAVKPDIGKVEVGESIRFGYYRQQGISFKEDSKVIDLVKEIAEAIKMGSGKIVSAAEFLNYFMFPFPMHQQPVYKLSGGEKRRLYLVTVLMQSPNFLILDEPTNDLDILTLNVLEDYLSTFKGCVLAVSHDRYFLDKVVDHLFVFKGEGKIRDFPGNYTIYREHEDVEKRRAFLLKKPKPVKTDKPKEKDPAKLSYREKVEIETLEKEISRLEEERSDIETALHAGDLTPEELMEKSERFAAILNQIEEKTGRWMELSERS
jgi:ABC transport system ATP-binding/permease protein